MADEPHPPPPDKWKQTIDHYAEQAIRILFFWETNDKRLGTFVRLLHHILIYSLLICYIGINTVFPSYLAFLGLYCICFLIWVHHILSKGCCLNRIEQKLIGDTRTFVGPILEIYNIPVTPESTDGITVLGATVVMFFLTFEWVSRTIQIGKQWLGW